MPIAPRRLATLLLLLVLPLRVYAAAAMVLCGQPTGTMPMAVQHEASEQSGDLCAMEHGAQPDEHDTGSTDHPGHLSCAACCCTGVIAASQDWNPHAFGIPASTAFAPADLPPPVHDRLERPPRTIVA